MESAEFKWEDDEFDDTFFQEVDKLEELAILTQHHHHHPHPPKPSSSSAAFHQLPPPPPPIISGTSFANNNGGSTVIDVSYSPPRELSQRFQPPLDTANSNSSNTQEQFEIDRLKSELSRVSKQLSDLKEECSELRRDRDKKKQPKCVSSNVEASIRNAGAPVLDLPRSGSALRCENAGAGPAASSSERKSVAIQTERIDESVSPNTNTATSKLLAVWSSGSSHISRRNFIAKLLETCASDFCFLFGCLDPNMPFKIEGGRLNLVGVPGSVQGLHSAKAARMSHLYSVLMKLSNDLAHVDALVEALLDLCSLENALVVRRSLHILHVALDHLLSMDRSPPRRDNVKVERFDSDAVHMHDLEVGKSGHMYDTSGRETTSSSYRIPFKNIGVADCENASMLCHVNWFDLFESLRQIAVRLTEEHARMEAVSIMNLIVMRTDTYSARIKFGSSLVFKAVALLLRKKAGVFVQKEAIHLVYLLLNSPNILATFCTSCKDAEGHMRSSNDGDKNITFEESSGILEGLADCIVCPGFREKELNLRRNAIMVLAFLASSGKLGLEIFLFHKLSERANFLGLILQVLVSEIDADALDSCSAPEVTKERTLLIREALILLNRLASHPAYSTTVLQVLTSCRDLVSLAIDVASRLSKKSRRLLKCDSITRQMRESEVVELARVFRKRVFTFLGENI